MSDLSFERWKLQLSSGMDEIVRLEQSKHELREQLFFLDLHQQATFRQYQKLLAKIGTLVPNPDVKKPLSMASLEHDLPPIDDIARRLADLSKKAQAANSDFQQTKEFLLVAKHKTALIEQIRIIPSSGDRKPRADVAADEAVEARVRELAKKLRLQKLGEKYEREIEALKALELRLQESLEILVEMGTDLVRERRWHLSAFPATGKGPWTIHHEEFSLD
jgi:hypothetical protein